MQGTHALCVGVTVRVVHDANVHLEMSQFKAFFNGSIL
jgi:hypothetical protein